MYIFLKKSIIILISFFITVCLSRISSDYAFGFLNEIRDTVLVSLFYKLNTPKLIFLIYEYQKNLAWSLLLIFSMCWFFLLFSINKFAGIKIYVMIGIGFFINFSIGILIVNEADNVMLNYIYYLYSIFTFKYFYDFLSLRLVKKK